MRVEPVWVQAEIAGEVSLAPLTSSSVTASIGSLEIRLEPAPFPTITWSVANASDRSVRVRSVAVVFAVVGAVEPVRLFRHGYQSWSPTGVATLGVDRDPSTVADFEFLQAAHHADQRRAADGELRS